MKTLSLFFLLLAIHVLSAQQVSVLSEKIDHLKKVHTYHVNADINFHNTESYGFTDKGSLVAIIDSALVCYGVDGQIEWERAVPARAVQPSPTGRKFLISYPVNQDYGVTEVLNSTGKVLWTKPSMGWVRWSPNSIYLYPHFDQDSPLDLRVYDAQTGQLVWQDKAMPMGKIEAIEALGDDILLVVDIEGRLRLFDLETGDISHELDVSKFFENRLSYADWHILTSQDGIFFTVLGACSWPKDSGVIYSFDKNVNSIWSEELDYRVWPNGLTEDGSKLVVCKGKSTKIYNNLNGTLLGEINEARTRRPTIVTNSFVVIPQRMGAYIFALTADGTVENRWITQSTFRKVGNRIFEVKRQNNLNLIQVLEGEKL